MKEITFPQLTVHYKNKYNVMESIKGATLNIYLLFNSQETVYFGYLWSEDVENHVYEILNHISWLMAKDLCTRSHQTSGARSCKQSLNTEDPSLKNIKSSQYNSFPNSVIKIIKI